MATTRRPCAAGCGAEVVGRADKRWCSEVCRKRAGRAGPATVTQLPTSPPSTAVADALRRELVELGVAQTYEARTALGLAEQLDSGRLVGAGYVSLSRELDRRVDSLRLRAVRPDDPARLLREALEAKRLELLQGGGA